jgi:glyoxylase-like metal-dependent hydrolase (beta-lactamase superfamily II)
VEIVEITSRVLGARCALVAAGEVAVVVDAGAGVADEVLSVAERQRLRIVAVLATHGHADHTWDAGVLTARLGVPLLIHAADAYRLDDPFGTLGALGVTPPGGEAALAQVLRQAGIDPAGYVRPERVVAFGGAPGSDGRSPDEVLELDGMTVVARHAPGHTEGSTIYLFDAPGPVALTGDVLFAGTIGRTDLPGGDDLVMARTLREVVEHLPHGTRVLPGHGPATNLAKELVHNPFLG